VFDSVDLSGAARFEAEVARESARSGSAEARLEVRTGDDRLVAEMAVPVTGSRYTWTTVTADATAPGDGVHDLRLTLHGDFRLSSFRFDSATDGTRGEDGTV
jgi:beta-glucosidase